MTRFLAGFLAFGFLLTFDPPTLAHDGGKKTDGVKPSITVSVYNYAQVPPQTLERMERDLARIMHDVAIEATWRNCNPELTDIHQDVNCNLRDYSLDRPTYL